MNLNLIPISHLSKYLQSPTPSQPTPHSKARSKVRYLSAETHKPVKNRGGYKKKKLCNYQNYRALYQMGGTGLEPVTPCL